MQEEQVQKLYRWIGGAAATAVCGLAAVTMWAQTAATPEKHVKDQAEFDLYNAVTKDMLAKNGEQALKDLDAWKQHNPDSAFKDDREVMYLQAYEMSKQWDKELLKAKELMDKDLNAMFPDPTQGPKEALQIYFGAVTAASTIQNPTPDQLAIGVEAAHKILSFDRVPKGVSPADWATAKKSLDAAANAMLYRAAILPAVQAQQKQDWASAEAAWLKAQGDFADKALIAYNLGVVYRAEHKDDLAMWQLARAGAIDPTLEGTANGAQITKFVNSFYTGLHGSADGLDQLEAQAKASAAPPAGFHVQTAAEIAEAKEKEFETTHPDIALWMHIKATLNSDSGQQYFDIGMKGAAVPELTGTVLESKCRARELEVAVPLPDATGPPVAEITLKLINDAGAASALTGKAETGRITFKGVAESYTKDPFMLTMTIDKKDIQGLTVTPCAPTTVRKKGKR